MRVFSSRIEQALEQRNVQGLTRKVQIVENNCGSNVLVNGHSYTNFSSNDYLGLANDASLVRAWQQGVDLYGCGSGASPLVTGFSKAHQQLEHDLCEWLGYERAVLFGSGFSANQAIIFSLLQKGDLLLQDKLNHASLMEAGMLSPSTMKRFKHNDVDHLSSLLTSESELATMVVTEGVFSMDGDCAPLSCIAKKTSNVAMLVVDDAHGIGVLGKQGMGSSALAGVKPDVLVVTFGKAFGLSGAAILCKSSIAEYLTQFARHHVYSTAIPPSLAHALSAAVAMIKKDQWRRDKLSELSNCLEVELESVEGYTATSTPIKPFILGDSKTAVKIADSMKRAGHWVTAIRPPTVAKGCARLRITLTANHSVEQVVLLCTALKTALEVN